MYMSQVSFVFILIALEIGLWAMAEVGNGEFVGRGGRG